MAAIFIFFIQGNIQHFAGFFYYYYYYFSLSQKKKFFFDNGRFNWCRLDQLDAIGTRFVLINHRFVNHHLS